MSVDNLLPSIRYFTTFDDLTQPRLPRFKKTFLGVLPFLGLLYAWLSLDKSLLSVSGAFLILITSLVPAWLWVNGKAKGLPVYPLYALSFIWTYSIPLISDHPIVTIFPDTYHFFGAICISLCGLGGTAAWYFFVKRLAPVPRSAFVLPMAQGRAIFWFFLGASLLFNLVTYSGMVSTDTQGFSTVRGFALGIASIAGFYFGYQHGIGALNPLARFGYLALVAGGAMITVTGMLLAYAAASALTCLLGYIMGRGKVPWLAIAAISAVFVFLHAGKANQREKYWSEQMWQTVSIPEYPVFFYDWFYHSVDEIQEGLSPASMQKKEREETNRNLFERTSLMHLFLYFQYSTGSQIPYLWGLTYSVIPELLIPRIFLKEKALSHFGNNVLAVHYGIVPNDAETQTSVGFGFINEGYANFGLIGAFGISVIVGALYGWIGKISACVPTMSLRFLASVVVMSAAIQSEQTMGVFVSSTFQAVMAFILASGIFMQRYPLAKVNYLIRSVLQSMGKKSAIEA